MKIKNLFYPLTLAMAAMTMTACSTEDDAATAKAGQTGTFQVSINVGPAQTRAISVGGNDCHTLYTNWDNGDKVRVVQGTTKLEQLTADVSAGNTAYATLTGTLTGTFNVGDELTLYYHDADLDYTGQTGTIGCVSTSKSFLTATSTVQQINQGTGTISNNGGYLVMSNASYSPMQAYLDISFTDDDSKALAITQLDIWTSGGKLVKTAPLGGEKTYATEESPLTVNPDAATDHFFLALRDEAGASNTIYFKATTANNAYIYSQESNLAIGGYYYAASPKAMTSLRGTITRGDGGTVPEPSNNCYYFYQNGSNPIDVTLSGMLRGYRFNFYADGTVYLIDLQAEYSESWNSETLYSYHDLTLDIAGDNSVIHKTAYQSVACEGNLFLRGNGTLTVSGKNSETSLERCGFHSNNFQNGGDPSVLAADGYTVTRSDATAFDTDNNGIADYYTWTYTVKPAGPLSGKFTVNAGGSQVSFSKGNLQATTRDNGKHWSWDFATNQWDCIGNAAANNAINGNGTVSTNGTVDLFRWVGASSGFTGGAQYGISNSETASDYGTSASESLKSDWGNTIGTGWRTLTSAEWYYLLAIRTSGSTVNGTSNARCTMATINTDGTAVKGLILFPDGVTIAADEATSWGDINYKSNYATNCTTDQWTALAAKGCVFLPAAGSRSGYGINSVGNNGLYWSSTPYEYSADKAYYSSFTSSLLNPYNYTARIVGCAVRLVKDVQP